MSELFASVQALVIAWLPWVLGAFLLLNVAVFILYYLDMPPGEGRTAATFQRYFATVRSVLRLKREIKGEPLAKDPHRRSTPQAMGTISDFVPPPAKPRRRDPE